MVDWVLLDFETASACDLKKAGAWRYAEDPTTEVLCLSHSVNGQEPVTWVPGGDATRLLAQARDSEVLFLAHNAGFEKAIWRRLMVEQYGWPDIPNSRWHDTLAVCAMRAIPLALEDAALVLRLPHQKDAEGRRAVLDLSKFAKSGYVNDRVGKLTRTYAYCPQDVRAEVALHERLGWLPPSERKIWLLDQRINERGLRVDLEYVCSAARIVEDASGPLAQEFRAVTGGLNYGQRDKVLAWAATEGVSLPDLRKETIAEALGTDVDAEDESDASEEENPPERVELPPHVHRALSVRQLVNSSSVKKLARMEACVCADGRARGLLQYHGTGPGRWAGRLLQPQNFPRPTIKVDDKPVDHNIVIEAIKTGDHAYVAAVLGPPIEVVVSGLRHAIVATPGRVLLSGDYAGIQARVVLALAGQHDKTALMASGADVYCDMATQIYKRPIDKKADPQERQTGKNSVLGLGFQMGWRKFKLKYGRQHTDEFCEEIVHVYRKEWAPRVPFCWYGLQDAAVNTVWHGTPHEAYGVAYALEDSWLTARLPSGRKIWYFNPRKERRPMPWDPDDIRPSFTYQAMKTGRWTTIHAFGGLLTENVVMGIERDIMVGGMFRLEQNGFPIVLTVHDEIVAEPLAADANETAFTQIMLDVEPWVRHLQIPIAVETWQGGRYRK